MLTARSSSPVGFALVAWLILAGVAPMVQAADEADALRTRALALNDLTGDDPIEGQIKVLLDDPEGTKKLLATAKSMAKEKKQPFGYNAAFVLARVSLQIKDLESCQVFLLVCKDQAIQLQSGRKLIQSFGALIELLYEQKKYDEVVKICREFVEMTGNDTVDRLKPAVMEKMIQSLARQGKTKEALKLVNNLVEAEDEDGGWWYLQLKGWVQREAGDFSDAAKTYESVLERIAKDKTLKKEQKSSFAERARYLLSGVYIDAKQVDKATEHLQTLLKEKPDDATYNNDLGYIWADNDKNLDEAEKMIRKAIDQDRKERKANPDLTPDEDKDNAAYLDSLGWVLYKQKKYAEAKKHLQEAVKEKDGQHIEIFDHLGDVLQALNEKDAAIDAWKKGIEHAGAGRREQERKVIVEKKIKAQE